VQEAVVVQVALPLGLLAVLGVEVMPGQDRVRVLPQQEEQLIQVVAVVLQILVLAEELLVVLA
jgi:hypothetical protein